MKYIMLRLSLLLCMFWIVPLSVSAANEPQFVLSLNNNQTVSGDTVQVTVLGQGLTDLYAYEVTLEFDSTHLSYDSWTAPATGYSIAPIVTGNQFTFAHTKIGNSVGDTGDLDLGKITFKTNGVGNAVVRLKSVKLVDSNLESTVQTPDTQVTATISVVHTITATAGNNGIISPSGVVSVNDGADQTFTITPSNGYIIDTFKVDDTDATVTNNTYTFANVTSDHTISVTFKQVPPTVHTITATAGNNGIISPSGSVTVNDGANQTFTIIPDIGYMIDSLKVDGMDAVVTNNTYTITSVTNDHTIDVTFKQVPPTVHTITATAGNNGAISPSGSVPVNDGADQTFTITPDNGYMVDSFKVDGTDATVSNNTYRFINVKSNHEIAVMFKAVQTGNPGNSNQDKDKDKDKDKVKGSNINIIIDGKEESAGTVKISNRNDQQVVTVSIDQEKLDQRLAEVGRNAVITIPIDISTDIVVSELNGQMIKNMENKDAVLEIKTEQATYKIPAQQLNINAISSQIGKSVGLQDIKIQVEMASLTAETAKIVQNVADKGKFTVVAPAIDFTVTATYGNQTVDISKFNMYVERMVAIPDGVDPSKITTGVVIELNGNVRHVPTKLVQMDGKYYAVMNSLTNSTYTVVSHSIEFSDVANHWSKQAVNAMGSRMVIEGTGDGMFSPDKDITRAEFAAIVVRGLGLKLESGATSFTDVNELDWYSSVIKTAVSNQLISGFEDGSFHPTDKITREQAMAIIAKAMVVTGLKAKLPAQDVNTTLSLYTDGAVTSAWAQSHVADCLLSGILTGRSDTSIAPQSTITRAEVATMIQRLLQKSDLIQ